MKLTRCFVNNCIEINTEFDLLRKSTRLVIDRMTGGQRDQEPVKISLVSNMTKISASVKTHALAGKFISFLQKAIQAKSTETYRLFVSMKENIERRH